jgi:hypothetical protein
MYQGHENTKDVGLAQGMIQGTLDNAVCVCFYDNVLGILTEIYHKTVCSYMYVDNRFL